MENIVKTPRLHVPVMPVEVLQGLDLKAGDVVIDGTVGLGGHAALILERTAPTGRLIAIDRDARNLVVAKENLAAFGERVSYVRASYADMAEHAKDVDAVLLDIGFSSVHVDDASRGFSFQSEGPLDMRYDTTMGETAADLVNGATDVELAEILRVYGEETMARRIAGAIVAARRAKKFVTTTDLATVITTLIPRHGKTHPATKTFQALRIAVNDELGELKRGLEAALQVLKPGGRLVVITFHSLEDRLVKHALRDDDRWDAVKKAIKPGREEQVANPRSRSAKVRIAIKR